MNLSTYFLIVIIVFLAFIDIVTCSIKFCQYDSKTNDCREIDIPELKIGDLSTYSLRRQTDEIEPRYGGNQVYVQVTQGLNQNPSQYDQNIPRPGYDQRQPGYDQIQPGYNQNQPGYNQNQLGYNQNQPGYGQNQLRPEYGPSYSEYNQSPQSYQGYDVNQPRPGYNQNQPRYEDFPEYSQFKPEYLVMPGVGPVNIGYNQEQPEYEQVVLEYGQSNPLYVEPIMGLIQQDTILDRLILPSISLNDDYYDDEDLLIAGSILFN